MALRGQGSLQLLLGKSVFGAKKRKAGKEEPNTATKRQQTFDPKSGCVCHTTNQPTEARPSLPPRRPPRLQRPATPLSNPNRLDGHPLPEQLLDPHLHAAEQLDLPAPPDGSGWLRIEAAVVGLRFRRASSAAAVAAVAATAVPSHPSAAAAAADSTVHRMNSWPPVQGHQYRLVPEPTNPQDVNAVQVLLCTTTAGSSSGGPSATPPAAANGGEDLLVGYLPAAVAAHLGPLLRAGQLETQVHVCWAAHMQGAGSVPLVVYARAAEAVHSGVSVGEGGCSSSDGGGGCAASTAGPGASKLVVSDGAQTYTVVGDGNVGTATRTAASARLRGCGVGAEAADSRDADGGQKSGDVAGLRGGTAGGGGAAGPREGSGADGATAATEAALEAAVAAAAAWRLARSSPNTAAGEVLRSNFATMAADVRRHDGHLLTSLELGLLDRLQGLPPPAQCLFLRLLLRRGPWFTLRGITYLECGDVAVAAEALVAAELAVRPQPEDWPQVAELLPVAEVRALLATMAGPNHRRRHHHHHHHRKHQPNQRGLRAHEDPRRSLSQHQHHHHHQHYQPPPKSSILAYTRRHVDRPAAADGVTAAVAAGAATDGVQDADGSAGAGDAGAGAQALATGTRTADHSVAQASAGAMAPLAVAADCAAEVVSGGNEIYSGGRVLNGGSGGGHLAVGSLHVGDPEGDGGGGGGGVGLRSSGAARGKRRGCSGGSANGGGGGGGGKAAEIEELRRRCTDCTTEISRRVEAMVGPCIRLSPPSLELLARMQRLYFLAEGPAADLGRFLATERGVIRYPTYTINRSSSAFTCRQQLLEYEQALDHAAQLESCLEAGDDAGVAAALAPALAAVRAGAHRLVRWRGDATIPVRAVPGPWPWEAAPTAGCAAADVKDGSMACPTGAASGDDGGMSDGAGGPQVRGSAEPQAPAGMSSGTALTAVAKASCTCHSDGSFAENRSAGGGDSGMRRGDDPWVGGEGQCLRCGGGKRAPPPPPSGAGCGVLESVDLTYSSDDEGGGDGVEMENGGDTVTPAAAVMSTGPCRRGAAAAVAVGAVVAKAVAAAAMEAAASVKPAAQGKEEVAALGLRTEHVVQQAMQGHFPVVQVAGYADGRRVGACQKQPPLGEVGGQTPEEANRDVGTVIDVGVDVGVNLSVGHDGGGVAGILQPAGGGGEDDIMYGDEYDILYTTDCGGVSPGNTAAANPNSDACRQQQQQQLDGEVGPRDDAHQVSPDRQEPSSRLDVEPIPGEMQERTQQPQPQPQPQQFLARFCAAWVYASMTTVGVSFLERHRRYGEAVCLLRQLLQGRCCPGRRGEWWMRMSVDLQHLGREEEALLVAEAALTDPWVRHGDRLALQRRVLRLGKPPRRWRRPPWAAAALAEPREVVVSGHMLRGRTGLKSRFLAPSAQSVAASSAAGTNPPGPAPARPSAVGAAGPAAASPLVTVEQLALLHYCSPAGGGWRGVHSEGGVWVTMWALLCWDVLFMDVPEVFRNPFQTSPLDLDTDAFLPARRAAVDERLQLIASGGGPELLRSVWSRHAGTWCRGVHWGRLPLGELLQIARCVGGLGLSVVCRRLCEDAGGWRGGMPDLLLWRPERGDAMVSEVKGPRDRLSDQQRAWLAALAAAGVRAEVLRVVEAAPPPRRHADHGAQQRDAEGAVDAAVPAAVAVADVAAAAAAAPAAVAALTGDLGGGGARAGRRVLLRGRRAAAAVPIACEGVAAKRPEDHPAVASFGVGAALAVPAAGASLAAAPCGGISSCGAVDGVVVISDDGGDADADDH